MDKKVKLKCPNCDDKFVTNIRTQIWCSKECGTRFLEINKSIKENKSKQKNMLDDKIHYDLESDKMYNKKIYEAIKTKHS